MIPARTALAQTAAAPKPRMGFIYFPHGAIMEQWTPATEGTGFELPPILKPLEPFQKQLTIVSGLENKPASAPPVHALSPGTWLSCVTPARRARSRTAASRSTRSPRSTSARTRRCRRSKSRPKARGGGGACDRNYGCSYGGTISFRTPTTPLPMEADPRKLFERLFGQGDTPEERKRHREAVRAACSTWCRGSARTCSRRSARADRAMLDDYLESVREIERRVQKMEARDLSSVDLPDAPVGAPTLRRAAQPDVRHDRAGVSGEPDARLHAS